MRLTRALRIKLCVHVCSFAECLGHLGQLQPTMGAQQALPYLAGAGAVNALPDIDPSATNYFTDFYCPLVPKLPSEPPSHARWVAEVHANHALLKEVHPADPALLRNQKANTGGEIATSKPVRADGADDEAPPPVPLPPPLTFGMQDSAGVAPALYSRPVFTRPFMPPPNAGTSGFFKMHGTGSSSSSPPGQRPGAGNSATVAVYNPYQGAGGKPGRMQLHSQYPGGPPSGAAATATFYPSPYSAMPSLPPRMQSPPHSPPGPPRHSQSPAHHSPHGSLPLGPAYPTVHHAAPPQHHGQPAGQPPGRYGQGAQPPRYPQVGSPTAPAAYPAVAGPAPNGVHQYGAPAQHGHGVPAGAGYPVPNHASSPAYAAPPAQPPLYPPPR